jgi:hemoglobin
MEKAHTGLNLQPEHFDAIAKHLGEALDEHRVSQEDINSVLARVSTLKEAVLYKWWFECRLRRGDQLVWSQCW